MSNTHFAWPYGGVDLGTWLRSWERRVAGRPADRWTYSITREERYQQQGETRELSGPDDAVRALQAHATHAAEVSVHPGIPGRLSVLGGSRQLPWEVVGFGVGAHWDDGMHMRAVVTSPGELAGWLAGLGRALLEEDLPHPRVPSGAIAPVEVTLTAVGRLRFTIRVTDRYGVLTCTGQTAEFAKQTLHLPALAGLAHRPVATLRELADWLGEVAGRLTGTAVEFTVPHDAPLPPGTLAQLKELYLGGVEVVVGPAPASGAASGGVACIARPDSLTAHASTLLHPVVHGVAWLEDAPGLARWLRAVEQAAFGPAPAAAVGWATCWPGRYQPFEAFGAAEPFAERVLELGGPLTARVTCIDRRLAEAVVASGERELTVGAWPGGTQATFPGLRLSGKGLPVDPAHKGHISRFDSRRPAQAP